MIRAAGQKTRSYEQLLDLLPTVWVREAADPWYMASEIVTVFTQGVISESTGAAARRVATASEMRLGREALEKFLGHLRRHPGHLGLYGYIKWNTWLQGILCNDPQLTRLLAGGARSLAAWMEEAGAAPGLLPDGRPLHNVAYSCCNLVIWIRTVHDLQNIQREAAAFAPLVEQERHHLDLLTMLEHGEVMAARSLWSLAITSPVIEATLRRLVAAPPSSLLHATLAKPIAELVATVGRGKRTDPWALTEARSVVTLLMRTFNGCFEIWQKTVGQERLPGPRAFKSVWDDIRAIAAFKTSGYPWFEPLTACGGLPDLRLPAGTPRMTAANCSLQKKEACRDAAIAATCINHAAKTVAALDAAGGAAQWPVLRAGILSLPPPQSVNVGTPEELLAHRMAGLNPGAAHQVNLEAQAASERMRTRRDPAAGCAGCGRSAADAAAAGAQLPTGPNGAPKLLTCSRCQGPRYCSVACQRVYWKAGHSKSCEKKE